MSNTNKFEQFESPKKIGSINRDFLAEAVLRAHSSNADQEAPRGRRNSSQPTQLTV
ncbi:MAG TPA: hypothetical protein VH595_24000 [Verrucomicrobiae bacterium]|jgi:hypothetical protein|nr:hypothetical protein [Verrucomicrobiae bacterium]